MHDNDERDEKRGYGFGLVLVVLLLAMLFFDVVGRVLDVVVVVLTLGLSASLVLDFVYIRVPASRANLGFLASSVAREVVREDADKDYRVILGEWLEKRVNAVFLLGACSVYLLLAGLGCLAHSVMV